MPLRERRDHEQGHAGSEARFTTGVAHPRVLTPGEVWVTVDERREVRVRRHRRRHVVPPAAGLIEGDENRGVLPVGAGLYPIDQVTDEGVIGHRTRVTGVAVRRRGRLYPGDSWQPGDDAADRRSGECVIEDRKVALVAIGLREVHARVPGPRMRRVGGRGEVLKRIVVRDVAGAGRRDAGAGTTLA